MFVTRKDVATVFGICLFLASTAVCSARGETARDLVKQARRAASEDRHRESIDLFQRAIEMDPATESNVAREMGDQYTWAEEPDSAIHWYERYLVTHPRDFDARFGIARAQSWADRLEESRRLYEELLPDSGERELEVRLGLAQVANWSGQHRRAERMYRDILEDEPDNTEALSGLAYAQLWAGRTDLAAATVAGAEDAAGLEGVSRDIDRSRSPSGATSYSWKEDSDDRLIQEVSQAAEISPTYLSRVGLVYRWGELTKPGLPDITRDELVLKIERRLSSKVSYSASPGYQWNRFSSITVPPSTTAIDQFNRLIWDLYVTVLPMDWVRIDVGTAREVLDIPESIFREIDRTGVSLSLDWRFRNDLITYVQTDYYDYSDLNQRFSLGWRLVWRPPWRIPYRPRNFFEYTLGARLIDFKRQLDNGYFNPNTFVTAYNEVRFVNEFGDRVTLDVKGGFGFEKDNDSEAQAIGSVETVLRYNLHDRVFLGAGYFYSDSQLDSATGYSIQGFSVSLDYSM